MTIAAPLELVHVQHPQTLADYAAVSSLAPAVKDLQTEAAALLPRLAGRRIWMVSSTARGGGVAEMLPTIVSLIRDLGIPIEWVVMHTDEPEFFVLTKHIHNLIHGAGPPRLDGAAKDLFERVNRANADALRPRLRSGDVLIVHDPQPIAMAAMLRTTMSLATIWRCHIGLDEENAATLAAWSFLAPYLDAYDHAVFTAPEYIPRRVARRATVIAPGIDPIAPKNMELSLRHTVEILCNGGLTVPPGPVVHPPFAARARRLLPNGSFAVANAMEDIGLLTRPIITQVSRWDRLKGWLPLMRAFAALKESVAHRARDELPQRRLELVRLVLAGPEPEGIQDDPEALEVLEELRAAYAAMLPGVQSEIALLAIPMASVEENALMVNALQRASTLVVQNSLREGFGLTIAEAMWKRVPVLSNSRACGPRQQIDDGVDGRLIADPEDQAELQQALEEILVDADLRHRWGRAARRKVYEKFLVISQMRQWGQLLRTLLPD